MSHVDEGTLHALLDGALEGAPELAEVQQHLAECAECRQRLEEAHALSARAASLLNTAPAGEITTPPFAAVLARKHRSAARPRVFGMKRLTAIGWAATIVMAVGVGWLARGSLPLTDEADLQRRHAPSEQVAELEAPAEEGRSVANDANADESTVGAVAGVEAEPHPPTTRQEPAAKSTVVPAAPTVIADAAGRGEEMEREAAGPPMPARADEDRSVAPLAAPAEPLLQEQARRTPVAAEALASRVPVLRNADWNASTAEDAAAQLGVPLRTVAGLDVLQFETGTVAGVPAVRVMQQLGTDSLVIVQYAVSAELSAEGGGFADRDDAGSVVVQRDGFVLVLRAPVSGDSLRRLADRIP